MQSSPSDLERVTQIPALAPRPLDSNKGSFGRILIAAGSRGMSGAAILAGGGALRGGAGLVRVAVPISIQPVVAAANPCYLTAGLADDSDGRLDSKAEEVLLNLAQANDVVALGPGLGRSTGLDEEVAALVSRIAKPLVLDADGLNALVGKTNLLRDRASPTILTPHPGEFARLLGTDILTVQANRQALAAQFAAHHRVVLLLKGHGTVVTDGRRIYVNDTGNPGMATGGSGDVLTGLIAALLGQGLEPFAAAQLGAHVHGLAGDLARAEIGETSLIASDLLQYLPRAFRGFGQR